jgi:hypothetical protein
MATSKTLQITNPVAGLTTSQAISDLNGYNSLSFNAKYEHATLDTANLTLYFSNDGITYEELKVITLENGITKIDELGIVGRFLKFTLENTDVTNMTLSQVYFYAHNESYNHIADLPSGSATSSNQVVTNTKLGEIDTVLDDIKIDTGNIDAKITKGNDATLTTTQQVLMYGRTNGNQLNALKTDGNGKLDVNTEIDVNPVNSTATNKNSMSNVAMNGYVDNSGSPYFRNLQLTATDNKLMVNDSDVITKLGEIDSVLDNIELNTAHRATTSNAISGFGTVVSAFTSSIDLGDVPKDKYDCIMVNGLNTLSTFEFVLEFSENGNDWGTDGLKPQLTQIGANYSFSLTRSKIGCRYVRLRCLVVGAGVVLNYTLSKFN